ncbi:MAG: hypothetical protein QM783_19465 [Phycisphaerales bacterium]
MKKIIFTAAVLAVAAAANAQLTNGGFEDGNFNGWQQFGDMGFTSVTGQINTTLPAEGNFHAVFGPTGGMGGIQQTIAANAGDTILVTYMLGCNPYGGNVNDAYSVDLGGVNLAGGVNTGSMPYTQFSFEVVTPVANPTLSFSFFNSPDWYMLDNVTASVAPTPGAAALIGLGGLMGGRRRRR